MSETPQEAAKTRRRWINLGEIVGILALAISAASFWDSHSEREAELAVKAAAPASRTGGLVLTGTVDAARDRLDLRAAAADQVIQTQTLHFPASVRADPVETTGSPRIESGWFDAGLRDAIRSAKAAPGDAAPGVTAPAKATARSAPAGARRRHHVAVGIETVYVAGDVTRTDRAVYDIGYTLRERFLRPDAVELEGISLVEPRVGADLQARVDARFARQAR